jgi:hypothetical protein
MMWSPTAERPCLHAEVTYGTQAWLLHMLRRACLCPAKAGLRAGRRNPPKRTLIRSLGVSMGTPFALMPDLKAVAVCVGG